MGQSPLAFVVMPFSATRTCTDVEWTQIFETIFRPTMESLGYSCERAMPTSGSLIGSIIEKLRSAHVVLADVTDRNANVFYELGVRHSLRRGTIIVSQNEEDVPSDLRGYWCVKYGTRSWDLPRFALGISRAVSEIKDHPDRSDSPVADFLGAEQLGISTLIQRDNIKKLLALRTEVSGNLLELEHPQSYSGSSFDDDCLALLLTTLYVDLGPEFLKHAYEFRWRLRALRANLVDMSMAREAMELGVWLVPRIDEILSRLRDGSFSEPHSISEMVWKPANIGDS